MSLLCGRLPRSLWVVTPGVILFASLVGTSAPAAQLSTQIVVTSVEDTVNGDASSPAALHANPGPDGISLREAILATNNAPGTYTISFATPLKGSAILVSTQLPPLSGGGVTIEGDIDGDGKPDVTLGKSPNFFWNANCASSDGCAFLIASSENHLDNLTLDGFGAGVDVGPVTNSKQVVTNQTLADNSVTGLIMNNLTDFGIVLTYPFTPGCGLWGGSSQPCWTHDSWVNTTITGNTFNSSRNAIKLAAATAGDTFENTTITDNHIKSTGTDSGISLDIGSNATETTISDVLIARNSIFGPYGMGINLTAGSGRGASNVLSNVQVLDNRIDLVNSDQSLFCCQGIAIQAGNDALSAMSPEILPFTYSNGNETKNILLRGNTIQGTLVWGVMIVAGDGLGNSLNSVHDIQIQANSISSSTLANALLIWTDGGGASAGSSTVLGNAVTNITVNQNRLSVGKEAGSQPPGQGILFISAGGHAGQQGKINDIQLVNNVIGPGPVPVQLFGGIKGSTGNQLTGVQLTNDTLVADPGGTALEVASNQDSTGNSVSDISVLNSILWGNFKGETGVPSIKSSLVMGSEFANVNGNIQGDPKFVDPSRGDFHLQITSPAINAGSSSGAPTLDFDGVSRAAGQVDIGAYQYAGVPRPTPSPALSSSLQPKTSPTLKPVKAQSYNTIICVKGKSIKKVKAVKPKCPAGFRRR